MWVVYLLYNPETFQRIEGLTTFWILRSYRGCPFSGHLLPKCSPWTQGMHGWFEGGNESGFCHSVWGAQHLFQVNSKPFKEC